MQIRNLGGSGLRVSAVGLGCNNFGQRTDLETSRKVIHKAIDLGVTLFDTADIYAGMGGSEKPNLKAEFSDEPHARGVCSMARSSNPNSANSQFFICLDDASFLDGQYTVWGVVSDGMAAVDALPKGEPPRKPGQIVTAQVAADV